MAGMREQQVNRLALNLHSLCCSLIVQDHSVIAGVLGAGVNMKQGVAAAQRSRQLWRDAGSY
jgi:hypothetical protein